MKISSGQMSTRGVYFRFSVGEVVLCFEPDPCKAHVLYDAKVLECLPTKDKHGTKVPGYLVHFQGWNSSWDRVVGEHYILKNNEENQALMKKLADTARRQRQNKHRRHINDILHDAFGGSIPVYNSNSEQSETDESLAEEPSTAVRERKINGETRPKSKKIQQQKYSKIEAEIPEILRMRLEDDYVFINHQNKLTKLPAKPCVIDILESFMKTFSINSLCEPVDRDREKIRYTSSKDNTRITPYASITLCKEIVDGLRICFDFMLPLMLLYNAENQQYKKISSTITAADLNNDRLSELTASTVRQGKALLGKREASKDPAEEPSAKVTPRRMTRRSCADPSGTLEHPTMPEDQPKTPPVSSSNKSGDRSASKSTRPQFSRVRRRLDNPWDSPSAAVKPEPLGDMYGDDFHSNSPSHFPMATNQSADSVHCGHKEDVMESILTWQLLPSEFRKSGPVMPSQIYGVNHLLRLFVKLPELLSNMKMDDSKLQILLRFVNSCLQFLTERQSELFGDSLYDEA